MSGPTTTVLRRLRYTPLRDMVRGRITGRLDVARIIDDAGLPEEAAAIVRDVTRRARLWRIERVDVAAELCAHFLDGVASGATVEELAKSFGEPRSAARLIRRAKKRQRPLAWRLLKWIGAGCFVLVAIYLAIGLRLILDRPVASVDYVVILNSRAAGLPEDACAWPLYRRALLELPPEPERDRSALPADRGSEREPLPGEPGWVEIETLLEQSRSALALVRQGASRPGLGFVVGNGLTDEEDARLWPELREASGGTDLISVLLPHLAELRRLARLLRFEALDAASSADGRTALADVEAILSLGAHVRETPIMINDLVSISIAGLAIETAGDIMARWPETLDDRALVRLAHVVAGSHAFARPSMEGERLIFRDIVQRIYTDDGGGDGRLAISGVTLLDAAGSLPAPLPGAAGGAEWPDDALRLTVAPLYAYAVASRRDMLAEHERLFAMLEDDWRVPLWELERSSVEAQVEAWHESKLDTIRYLPLVLLMPALSKARTSYERLLIERDALLGALALELHHRRTGAWPESFDALVPEFLPWAPLDRFDGKPLRFTIGAGGRPLIYSVGTDRVDDGGAAVRDGAGSRWIPRTRAAHQSERGDWILWPRPVEPLEAE